MAKKQIRKKKEKTRLGVLFTCVGRRVELIRAFKLAGEELGMDLEIHGADASRLTPAMRLVDQAHVVPPITSGQYIDALTDIIQRRSIGLLIPLLDSELPLIAQARERFAQIGCRAMISSPAVIETCQDKLATYRALQNAKIDTPHTWPIIIIEEARRQQFPYFLKPRRGSAAKGNYIVRDADELTVLGKRVPGAIIQEYVEGEEYTLDVYTGLDGVARCVVPRKRLEVRTGEVSKGLVVKNREIMAVGERVAKMLGECRGMITVQCIVTPGSKVRVIEINARFGGGVPLAIHAGANFPKWMIQEHLGRRARVNATGFRDGVAMLRFDESVFVNGANRLLPTNSSAVTQRKNK